MLIISVNSLNIPESWAWIKIFDTVIPDGLFTDGNWILSKEFLTGNEVRLIQLADIGEGIFLDKSNKYISKERAIELNCTFLREGDILISRMADPIARSFILKKLPYESITAVDVAILRPSKYFYHKYLMWLFNSFIVREQAEVLASGTTRKRISRKNFEQIEVPIAPFDEQVRIVFKIEELLSRIELAESSLKKIYRAKKREDDLLYTLKHSILKKGFQGKLIPQNPNDEPVSSIVDIIKKEKLTYKPTKKNRRRRNRAKVD